MMAAKYFWPFRATDRKCYLRKMGNAELISSRTNARHDCRVLHEQVSITPIAHLDYCYSAIGIAERNTVIGAIAIPREDEDWYSPKPNAGHDCLPIARRIGTCNRYSAIEIAGRDPARGEAPFPGKIGSHRISWVVPALRIGKPEWPMRAMRYFSMLRCSRIGEAAVSAAKYEQLFSRRREMRN